MPNVKRVSPPIGATPMVPKNIPRVPPSSPLNRDPPDRLAIRVRPNIATQKNSAEPNRIESLAKGGERSKRNKTPAMPPMTEEIVARLMASTARPVFAIGYPSKAVAMDDGVPGVLTRIAAKEPPYIAPIYTAPRATSPFKGDMVKVNGRSTAKAIAAVRPGIAPTKSPADTPPNINKKTIGCKS